MSDAVKTQWGEALSPISPLRSRITDLHHLEHQMRIVQRCPFSQDILLILLLLDRFILTIVIIFIVVVIVVSGSDNRDCLRQKHSSVVCKAHQDGLGERIRARVARLATGADVPHCFFFFLVLLFPCRSHRVDA